VDAADKFDGAKNARALASSARKANSDRAIPRMMSTTPPLW
jgi:hypothetical protein